ncbi:unnamed protein product [Allacma fusca]|uniref:Ig-like domain-containing protein n=1 Tax=Allacma fusca TaxID=39272 RepID=A0A8J2K842_9HEXA|nr:unnamed protein product [Allacma fusca]
MSVQSETVCRVLVEIAKMLFEPLRTDKNSYGGFTSFHYGPVLVNEPPQLVSFANDTGLWITCSAQGSPTPQISWIEDSSGLPLMAINGLRDVFSNGTVHIFPFAVQHFRSDVHSGDYRCLASNPVGTVISRRIRFRGGEFILS